MRKWWSAFAIVIGLSAIDAAWPPVGLWLAAFSLVGILAFFHWVGGRP